MQIVQKTAGRTGAARSDWRTAESKIEEPRLLGVPAPLGSGRRRDPRASQRSENLDPRPVAGAPPASQQRPQATCVHLGSPARSARCQRAGSCRSRLPGNQDKGAFARTGGPHPSGHALDGLPPTVERTHGRNHLMERCRRGGRPQSCTLGRRRSRDSPGAGLLAVDSSRAARSLLWVNCAFDDLLRGHRGHRRRPGGMWDPPADPVHEIRARGGHVDRGVRASASSSSAAGSRRWSKTRLPTSMKARLTRQPGRLHSPWGLAAITEPSSRRRP